MNRSKPGEEELEIACTLRKERKYTEGLAMLRKSVELENPNALFELYISYLYGGWGLEKDIRLSNSCLDLAAEKGSEFAAVCIQVQFELGDRSLDGTAPFQPIKLSRQAYYEKIIDPIARAYYFRHVLFSTARYEEYKEMDMSLSSIARDDSSLWRKIYAQYVLGEFYYNLRTNERSVKLGTIRKSKFWMTAAAGNGFAVAQWLLCNLHDEVTIDYEKSIPLELLYDACIQGIYRLYNDLANRINKRDDADWAEAAHWRVKFLQSRHRLVKSGVNVSIFLQVALSNRLVEMGIIRWRRFVSKEKIRPSKVQISDYLYSFSAIKSIERKKRANEYRELYVYGQAFFREPHLKQEIKWVDMSDRRCCRDVFRYSNRLARVSVIAFLGLRKRKAHPMSKDVCFLIGQMIWASRSDPIVWLK